MVEVNYTMIASDNHTEIPGPMPNMTVEELIDWSINEQQKRDIGVSPMARLAFINAFKSTGAPINNPEDELYASFEGDDTWKVSMATSVITWTTNPLSLNSAFSLDAIFPVDVCITGPLYVPRVLRFDHEASRFVIVMLNKDTNYLCVGVSNTNNPTGGWQVDTFVDPSFTYNRSFEFAIWGDVYNVCWMDALDQHKCVVLDRDALLLGAPQIAMLSTPLITGLNSSFAVPEIGLLHQSNSARGDLLTTDAPCGVFGLLKDESQSLDFLLCTGLNFSAPEGIVSFMMKSVPVGWVSGNGEACEVPGVGCIGVAGKKKNSLSTRVRFSYHAYSTYDRIAYGFTENILTTSSLVIGDMTDAELLAETTNVPERVPPVFPGYDIYAASVHLDCRETLFVAFKLLGATTESNYVSYRLKTDASLRMPLNTGLSNPIQNPSTGLCVFATNTVADRRVNVLHVGNGGYNFLDFRPQNQNFPIYYNASDDCTVQSCNQQAILGTVAPCTNIV